MEGRFADVALERFQSVWCVNPFVVSVKAVTVAEIPFTELLKTEVSRLQSKRYVSQSTTYLAPVQLRIDVT